MRRAFHQSLEVSEVIFEQPRHVVESMLRTETDRLGKEMTEAVLGAWDKANLPSRTAEFAQALSTALADQRRASDAR